MADVVKNMNESINTKMAAVQGTVVSSSAPGVPGVQSSELDGRLASVQTALEAKIDGVQREFSVQVSAVQTSVDTLTALVHEMRADLRASRGSANEA